jgi:hypothetical protein
LCALGNLVGSLLGTLGGFAEEDVQITELRALDVPVVFSELVVQRERRREIRVQRVDDLLGFLCVELQVVFFDGTELPHRFFLGAHTVPNSRAIGINLPI